MTPEKMTPEQWANKKGIEKPHAGFDPSVSLHQLSSMSEQAKSTRFKARVQERASTARTYQEAEKEWQDAVWQRYLEGKFTAHSVFDTEAFYVLSERLESVGIVIPSPFRLSQFKRAARAALLARADRKLWKMKLLTACPIVPSESPVGSSLPSEDS